MRAWFDILSLDRGSKQDESGIREAESQVHSLIRRENERGVPTDKIVLAGFSQGGALALHSALRYPERICGGRGAIDLLASAPHGRGRGRSRANRTTPFTMSHGSMDPLVPPHLGEETRATF